MAKILMINSEAAEEQATMQRTLATETIVKMAKFILASFAPLQYFLDTPGMTHAYCLDTALEVLRNDNRNDVANFFQSHYTKLRQGLFWADRGWKNASHYYCQPGSGLLSWPGALAECQLYFNKFITASEKDIGKAMFFLGAALHLVQDMCVPHHSIGAIFNGHQEFEQWATQHYEKFAVTTEGLYLPFLHPSQWVKYNAGISAFYYPLVSADRDRQYAQVCAALIPLTIRTTAGFLDFARQCIR